MQNDESMIKVKVLAFVHLPGLIQGPDGSCLHCLVNCLETAEGVFFSFLPSASVPRPPRVPCVPQGVLARPEVMSLEDCTKLQRFRCASHEGHEGANVQRCSKDFC